MRTFDVIVACDLQTGGIGYEGKIPWYLSHDLRHFYEITTQTSIPANRNAVIMGRKTWESIPRRPLSGRMNVIVSTTHNMTNESDNIHFVTSLSDAINAAFDTPDVENVYVIGGQRIYDEALRDPRCGKVYVTFVHLPKYPVQMDTFFPIDVLKDTQGPFKILSRTPFYREKELLYAYAIYDKK